MFFLKDCYVYILEGNDGSFYTGVTWNLRLRLLRHNGLQLGSAKYTRTRRPWFLVYFEKYPTRGEALKREHQIKHLTKEQKRELVNKASKEDLLSAV
jgi:putative endonuclease